MHYYILLTANNQDYGQTFSNKKKAIKLAKDLGRYTVIKVCIETGTEEVIHGLQKELV